MRYWARTGRTAIRALVVVMLIAGVSGCTSASANVSHGAADPAANDDALRIGSWNLLHAGWDVEKNYAAVAAVVQQFDLVAVQELMDPAALSRLERTLEARTGVEWAYIASEAEGRTSYKEHYGFIWRTAKVAYAGDGVSYIDDRDKFAREPFSALFKRKATGQTIALATVHIRYGDSHADRRPEIRALGRYWRWFMANYRHADLHVLMGDMNMEPDDPSWDVLDRSARLLITHGASTLSTTPGRYASLYDQIIVSDSWTPQVPVAVGIFTYPQAYDWGWWVRDHVSDHLPVFLVLGADHLDLQPFPPVPDSATATRHNCIQLNAASAERLDALPHVGPARAADIIAGRPWPSVNALVAIDGLGDARVADIKASGLPCMPVQTQ